MPKGVNNMFRRLLLILLAISFVSVAGCSKNLSPLSPELKQQLENTDGQIEELKNNQDGFLIEMGKIRNQSDMNARDIKDAQQGILNIKGMQNSGIQLFSGDGGVVMFIALLGAAVLFIYHYRDKAIKAEKTAEILAQSVALQKNEGLNEQIFMAAMNSEVQNDVYHLMTKAQSRVY